jgi:copper chaperone CopZ
MATIISNTPGRLRVRVGPDSRQPEALQRVHARVGEHPGVHSVASNPNTGSVVVRYDHHHHRLADVVGVLEDAGMIFESVEEGAEPETPDGDHSSTAAGIVGTFDDLDKRLSELTGHRVDLKLLFPLGLGAAGLYKLLRNGWEFADVPALVLLWYAFDAFHKLHRSQRQPQAADTAEPAKRRTAHHTAAGA